MSHNTSRYSLRATGHKGHGAYPWLPAEEPCFVYATRPCADRWQCAEPYGDGSDWHKRIHDEAEFFVACCLYGAAWHDEAHPERVKRLEFHWNAVSWGIMDRMIGQYVMTTGGFWRGLWNIMTLKRDRMVVSVRWALKRMIHRGWITRTLVNTHAFGSIALYAPAQPLVRLLQAKS